jgi:hypothetical protein
VDWQIQQHVGMYLTLLGPQGTEPIILAVPFSLCSISLGVFFSCTVTKVTDLRVFWDENTPGYNIDWSSEAITND